MNLRSIKGCALWQSSGGDSDAPQCVRAQSIGFLGKFNNKSAHTATGRHGAHPWYTEQSLGVALLTWISLSNHCERQYYFHSHLTDETTKNARKPDTCVSWVGNHWPGHNNSRFPSSSLSWLGQDRRGVVCSYGPKPEDPQRKFKGWRGKAMDSQETAEEGPPRRTWQIHPSRHSLRRAAQPLLSCEISVGHVKSARVCNSHEGIASSK